MASKGARSGRPRLPSPTITSTFAAPWERRTSAAASASAGWRSIVITSEANSERTAAEYPEPVPTSSTRSPPPSASAWQIAATIQGCEIVWPSAIGRAASA